MLQSILQGGESPALSAALFLGSAVVVWLAGTRLAAYADRFASAAGLGGALVGLLILGGVTSLPEIATSATAATRGAGGLAMNNLIGGVALQLLVLAVVDVLIGKGALTARPPRPDVMAYAGMNVLLLSVGAAAAAAGEIELFGTGVGLGTAAVAVAYGACLAVARAIERQVPWTPAPVEGRPAPDEEGDEDDATSNPKGSVAKLGLLIAATGLVILAAGYLLTRSGERLADATGLGQSFFGAVFLGGATSLPELSSAIAAVRLGRPQMAVGDVLGGNLFNLSLLLAVDVLYRDGPVMAEAGAFEVVAASLGSIMAAIYLLGLIERRDRTVLRMGLDSAVVLGVYAAGLAVLYTLRNTAAQ